MHGIQRAAANEWPHSRMSAFLSIALGADGPQAAPKPSFVADCLKH